MIGEFPLKDVTVYIRLSSPPENMCRNTLGPTGSLAGHYKGSSSDAMAYPSSTLFQSNINLSFNPLSGTESILSTLSGADFYLLIIPSLDHTRIIPTSVFNPSIQLQHASPQSLECRRDRKPVVRCFSCSHRCQATMDRWTIQSCGCPCQLS